MIDRRTFTTLLVGGIAAPQASLAGDTKAIDVFYAAVGPELTLYSVDADEATLVRRDTVSAPANIQYAWPHPSKQYLYVVSSNGGAGSEGVAGDKHFANALRAEGGVTLAALTRVILLCYYRDDRVMRSLGQEPRPPFPRGHVVEQGDWSLLDPVRKRSPMYRVVD